MPVAVSPQVYVIFNALIEERLGLHFGVETQDLLMEKLGARANEAGFESLLDYYYYLRYDDPDGAEFEALIDALVVNETYFFRELEPLAVVVEDLIAPRVERGERPRIWSAACSTGEEPLTVAMLLAEREMLGRVDIVASDISRKALARAQAGEYSPRSLRDIALPGPALPSGVERWLQRDQGKLRVASELREAVRWCRINLMDEVAVRALGRFDVILCRNVFIYFRDETARVIADRLALSLAPSGVLLVGISESLLRLGTALDFEEHRGVFLYRRAGAPGPGK
ncbi:MAG TPA: protein-glutamate O-methyltransferase CheR [Polyangia bacterium]|jgi:chemotaxis protein methyltransferase CheR|nr:protein-glutamate O-methyltransferase CheR [Polyangia bacterium]